MNDILQLHVYQLGDGEPEKTARNEFDLMGLYHELDSLPQYQQKPTTAGIAYHTVSTMLRDKFYDPVRTAQLQLPDDIGGGAFIDDQGHHTYVLWAVTHTDQSEKAEAFYSFPDAMKMKSLYQRAWDFSNVGITTLVNAKEIKLSGSPVFLIENKEDPTIPVSNIKLECNPNPFQEEILVKLSLPDSLISSLSLYSINGQLLENYFTNLKLAEGEHSIPIKGQNIPDGIYLLQLEVPDSRQVVCKLVKM
jgi:hypothetical protein